MDSEKDISPVLRGSRLSHSKSKLRDGSDDTSPIINTENSKAVLISENQSPQKRTWSSSKRLKRDEYGTSLAPDQKEQL